MATSSTPPAMAAPSPTPEIIPMPSAPARAAAAKLKRGGRILGLTKGHFSLGDLIRELLALTGPAAVSLSTWTAGIRDGRAMAGLLEEGQITSLRLLVDRSFATRQPRYCAAIRRMFGDDAIRCTKTHAKVVTIQGGGWHITCRTSMNLNKNPRFESFDVDDNEEIWRFFEAHFDEMSARMPPGPKVESWEVDAVFERALRGADPFTGIDRDWLLEAGAPLDADPGEFKTWVIMEMRANKKARRKPDGVPSLARALRVDPRAIRRALLTGATPAWRLSAALEVMRRRE